MWAGEALVDLHDFTCGYKVSRREVHEPVPVYGVLLASYLYFVLALVRRGPELPTDHPEAIRGARAGWPW